MFRDKDPSWRAVIPGRENDGERAVGDDPDDLTRTLAENGYARMDDDDDDDASSTSSEQDAYVTDIEDDEIGEEESGWKLIHGDVFRFPSNISLFSAFVGSGAQLCLTTFLLLLCAILGVFRPTKRGAILTTILIGEECANHEWWADCEEMFYGIGPSMYTLFQVLTLESWSMAIARPAMKVHRARPSARAKCYGSYSDPSKTGQMCYWYSTARL